MIRLNPPPSPEAELTLDEGYRRTPYKDSRGIWSCGIGCNLIAHGYTEAQCQAMPPWSDDKILAVFNADYNHASDLVEAHWKWTAHLDPIRHRSLVNMAFNMGVGKLATFDTFLGYLEAAQWAAASKDLMATEWATQVGARAERLEKRFDTGEYWT
jgi:lysozyme